MNNIKSGLNVRCFICGKVGNLYSNDDNTPFSASLVTIGLKTGCICMDCLKRLYQRNKQFFVDREDPSHPKTLKEKSLFASPKRNELPKNSKEDSNLVSLMTMWRCLDNSLESYVKLIQTRVFGQDEAVRITAQAIYNNQFCNLIEELGTENVPQRECVLLIGPTGVGKTYLAETTAKALGIPYAVTKADTLTSTGWVGCNVESILEHLYFAANRDIDSAERGIVILDEIDKKVARPSHFERDINGIAVQQELLKILEPSEVWILHDTVKFNTSRLTIILGGACVGLEDIIRKRLYPQSIGFTNEEPPTEFLLSKVEPGDLIKYGFIEEFVGRAPTPVVLRPLSFDTMLDIIYDKLSEEDTIFKCKKFKLAVDPLVLNKLANRAIEHKTGARDVRKEIIALLRNAKYKLYNVPSDGECHIDEYGNTTVLYKDAKTGSSQIYEAEGPDYLRYD